jgi:3-hydroxyacyl-[acyl-carrier-protein] dehydratase
MILRENLYSIVSQNILENRADFRIKLNAEHFIYKAHFPNNPITPGVCLIQMVAELFGVAKNADFIIKTLKNVKFTAPISPLEFSEIGVAVDFSENENFYQIKAVIKENETVFAKISMNLSEI